MSVFVPVLPETAPFSAEQRAWLNGYLAGLFAWKQDGSAAAANAPTEPLTILFASQTGGAEKAAKMLAKSAKSRGYSVTVKDMGDTKPADLVEAKRLCVIASTYGDGEPPDRAKDFWTALSNGAPRMEQTQFSVLALGDSNYPKFCEFGRNLDVRFEELGAQRLSDRRECDGDWADIFKEWTEAVLGAPAAATSAAEAEEEEGHREAPAPFITNLRLSAASSAKDVRHFEFSLKASGLKYSCGDALSVMPQNEPELVQQILDAAKLDGSATVQRKKQSLSLRESLLKYCEITRVPKTLLAECIQKSQNAELQALSSEEAIRAWMDGRDLLDLLTAAQDVEFSVESVHGALKDMKPRLYSISSSPAAHGDEVHLTVSAVRWMSQGRTRSGVCSTFLADRLALEDPAVVNIHENSAFRPPAGDVPLIMIGPGTGIAPFRGFLHERKALGHKGRNWLFFGDQRRETDYLYREEIESFAKDGTLTRLDLAWSREGEKKVYVQHRMLEHAAKLWEWLEDGAAIYVCGDASRMAKDVDTALHDVICKASSKSPEEAAEYVKQMKAQRRYQRDVY
jgi:sulfite reductase (NADPH) flavoprotein alpha-component